MPYFYLRAALSTKGFHAVREEDRNVKKQIISKWSEAVLCKGYACVKPLYLFLGPIQTLHSWCVFLDLGWKLGLRVLSLNSSPHSPSSCPSRCDGTSSTASWILEQLRLFRNRTLPMLHMIDRSSFSLNLGSNLFEKWHHQNENEN